MQSSKHDAEYLESRISEFLYTHQGFSAVSVESNKTSIINAFKQESKNLTEVGTLNWSMIAAREVDFKRREQQIASMEKVTVHDVNKLAYEVFYKSPRRINQKIFCHKHRDDAEKRKAHEALNKAFYERLQTEYDNKFDFVEIDPKDIAAFHAEHEFYPRWPESKE